MIVPAEVRQAFKQAWPVFWDEYIPELMKKNGWVEPPKGKDLVELWIEFCWDNMREVEDKQPLVQEEIGGADQ